MLYASEDVTVNHRVGGSIPSQGAIQLAFSHLSKTFCVIESDLRYSTRVVVRP